MRTEQKRIAALEGGIGALAVSSGQSAQFLTISTLAEAGDNIVASSQLYGGTYNQMKVAFPRMGVLVKFVTGNDPKSFEALIDDSTKVRPPSLLLRLSRRRRPSRPVLNQRLSHALPYTLASLCRETLAFDRKEAAFRAPQRGGSSRGASHASHCSLQ